MRFFDRIGGIGKKSRRFPRRFSSTSSATPPPSCPNCGRDMIPIIYGMPTTDGFRAAKRGVVILGGCMVDPTRQWGCGNCEKGNSET